jgi:hypothetical protein
MEIKQFFQKTLKSLLVQWKERISKILEMLKVSVLAFF